MTKTKDKVYDQVGNVKPYVERAMKDEQLRDDVMSAFHTAKELYNELIGGRGAVTLATRVATDDDVREKLRDAVEDLRSASDRLQGKKEHAKTLATCQDCATHCSAAASIVARKGPFSDLICKACAEACARCGKACEQFPDDKHMKMCAEECRKCEKECREMLKHTPAGKDK